MASQMTVEMPPEQGAPRRHVHAPKARSHHMAIIAMAFLALLGTLFWLGVVPRMRNRKALLHAAEIARTSVPTVAVTHPAQAGPVNLLLPGNAQAFQETTIYARTSGYLDKCLVDIGDKVQAGDLLAQISTPEVDQQLDQAKAQLAQAQANRDQMRAKLDQAKAEWERAQTLKQSNALADIEYIDYKSAYETAQAALEAAEAAIGSSQANVRQLADLQSYKRVVAPFSGVITQRSVDVGALISAGSSTSTTSLLRISQEDVLRIYANVPQASVPSIHVGQEAAVLVREYPDRRFKGKVARTANSLDQATRTLLVEVDVPNPDLALLPGMYVQVSFQVKPSAALWRVPASCLWLGPQGTQVALITGQNTIHYQTVTIARDLGNEIEVASGLNGDETLVRTPSAVLAEGAKVEVATNRG